MGDNPMKLRWVIWVSILACSAAVQAVRADGIAGVSCSENNVFIQMESGARRQFPTPSPCVSEGVSPSKRFAAWFTMVRDASSDNYKYNLFIYDGKKVLQPEFGRDRAYLNFQFEPDERVFVQMNEKDFSGP